MIRLRGVRFAYCQGANVLEGADLDLDGGITLLLGPNGSGKSTLMKIMAGIERPDEGYAQIQGHDLWRDEVAARRDLAYISEQPDLTPYATIGDIVHLVSRLRGEPWSRGKEALERAGLAALERRSVRELSMGQRRRAVLAAAWVDSPRVVLLDEPLEAMDRVMRRNMLSWIDGLVAAGAAIVVATHEVEPFVTSASRALTVREGKCAVFDPLPVDPPERMNLFERLAAGG